MILIFKHNVLKLCGIVGAMMVATAAHAVDWSVTASKEITLFFPGQASWERILMSDFHDGAQGVRGRKTCQSCHGGDELEIGNDIAKDADNIFHALSDGPTSLNAGLQIAVEDERIYFKLSLPAEVTGQLWLMLDNGAYSHSALSGCWSSCHDDAKGMASSDGMDLTKYLSVSRTSNTRTGGGDSFKSDAELASLMADGQYLEILGAEISSDSVAPIHEYVLEKRQVGPESEDHSGVSATIATKDPLKVIISRPLSPGATGFKELAPGTINTLAIAYHAPGEQGNKHLVSFAVEFKITPTNSVEFLGE